MTESLYEKIGGATAVDAAVDIFYRKILADDTINYFFDDTDMAAQRDKQKAFLTMAFGGPNEYDGKDLRTAHAPLVERGLNDSHFHAVAGNLKATLCEQNYFLACQFVPDEDIAVSLPDESCVAGHGSVIGLDPVNENICRVFLEPATPL